MPPTAMTPTAHALASLAHAQQQCDAGGRVGYRDLLSDAGMYIRQGVYWGVNAGRSAMALHADNVGTKQA